ncbi:MAG: hypothetical protein ABL984_21210, partial [Pyrinomonadaceae bacterium]
MRKVLTLLALYAIVLANTVAPVLALSSGETVGAGLINEFTESISTVPTEENTEMAAPMTGNPGACAPGVFTLTGNSSGSGSNGNIRTFTSNSGVNVKVSGFSRKYDNGAWETAFLAAFPPGLGVTDRGENGSDPQYKVDNAGSGNSRRNNYVLFEFDRSVIIDKTFLESITSDSDISVWVGNRTDPFN